MGWTSSYCCHRWKWIIAAQDRNGLRPLRYTVTSDKLLFAGSETGMIRFQMKK